MSENDAKAFDDNDGPLTGDALLHAVRQDLRELFGALDQKVVGLDAGVRASIKRLKVSMQGLTPDCAILPRCGK